MSEKQFAVKVPLVGYSLILVSAKNLDEAINIVSQQDFESDDHESVQLIGAQYKKACAPDADELAIFRRAYPCDNETPHDKSACTCNEKPHRISCPLGFDKYFPFQS